MRRDSGGDSHIILPSAFHPSCKVRSSGYSRRLLCVGFVKVFVSVAAIMIPWRKRRVYRSTSVLGND